LPIILDPKIIEKSSRTGGFFAPDYAQLFTILLLDLYNCLLLSYRPS